MGEKSPLVKYFYPETQTYIFCDILDQHSKEVYVITFIDPVTKKHTTRMCFKKELMFNATV